MPIQGPIVAIDPGSRMVGWAYLNDAHFVLGIASASDRHLGHRAIRIAAHIRGALPSTEGLHVVCEQMQARGLGRSLDDPNTLIEVQIVGSAVAGLLGGQSMHFVTAMEWKGSIPKHIHHQRFLAGLSEKHRKCIDIQLRETDKRIRHNAIDALAMAFKIRG